MLLGWFRAALAVVGGATLLVALVMVLDRDRLEERQQRRGGGAKPAAVAAVLGGFSAACAVLYWLSHRLSGPSYSRARQLAQKLVVPQETIDKYFGMTPGSQSDSRALTAPTSFDTSARDDEPRFRLE